MKKLSNEAGCPSTRAKRLAIDNCHRKLVVELRLYIRVKFTVPPPMTNSLWLIARLELTFIIFASLILVTLHAFNTHALRSQRRVPYNDLLSSQHVRSTSRLIRTSKHNETLRYT